LPLAIALQIQRAAGYFFKILGYPVTFEQWNNPGIKLLRLDSISPTPRATRAGLLLELLSFINFPDFIKLSNSRPSLNLIIKIIYLFSWT
jgi:hypothetical protein